MTRKPFQSKLVPHLEFIRECRSRQWSYPRIAAELHAKFGLTAAPSTIFAFVKVRARRRGVITLAAALPGVAPAHSAAPEALAVAPPHLVAPHRGQPGPPAGAGNPWQFYDPQKPLVKDAHEQIQ